MRGAVRRGFTLVEASMAMVIISVGVMAMLQLLAAGTVSNEDGAELTTAVNLANNIHEISLWLAFQDTNNPGSPTTKETSPANYNDIWDMNGDTYSPPLDVSRNSIATYGNWAQQVTVSTVDPNNVTATRPNDPTQPTARVTVIITHRGKQVYQASWLITAPNS
ncbi:MAG TPA: prepilin-type N-terminal cleavage/methylation domain-containing protein [Tepidisphaeraceae bacterium]|nr:prepilin-type N-terminal cleavage/methylation domain-containing protein [Tepidisphaeraceae bacterium]